MKNKYLIIYKDTQIVRAGNQGPKRIETHGSEIHEFTTEEYNIFANKRGRIILNIKTL